MPVNRAVRVIGTVPDLPTTPEFEMLVKARDDYQPGAVFIMNKARYIIKVAKPVGRGLMTVQLRRDMTTRKQRRARKL
jgi:hypothetical protein